MSQELLQLEPVNCRDSQTAFWPSFDLEAVLSGVEQEIVCPDGNYVLVQLYESPNGEKRLNFYCAHCQLDIINPSK